MNRSAPSAVEIAREVRRGRMSARRSVEDALARIAAIDPDVNAFTVVRRRAALREAEEAAAGGGGGASSPLRIPSTPIGRDGGASPAAEPGH